jgi:predicted amidohydrolase
LRVALVQLRTPATQSAALAHAAPLIREAAAGGATLVATPEATNLVQRDRAELAPRLVLAEADEAVVGLRDLAAELGVWLLIGSALVRREDGKASNRAFLIAPDGAVAASYDKIHMFDVDLPTGERMRESAAYEPGERLVTASAAGARLGLTVCYDVRFPPVFAALARAGAEVIAVPAAFTRPTGEAHWEILLRARAIETGSFVLAPAQGGVHEDGRGTWGHSLIIGPWGEVLAQADHDEPAVIFADLDLAAAQRARCAIPALANARAFAGP